MLRLLVLILLAYLVYRGVTSVLGQLRGAQGRYTIEPPPPRVTATVRREPREDTEELVACARCGVRVPASRTVAGVCAACRSAPAQ